MKNWSLEKLAKKLHMSVGDFLLSIAIVFILIASYFYIQDRETMKNMRGADSLQRQERLNVRKNVVVLGVDQLMEEDGGQRSDTIFVMMFDPENKKCSLLNIPRDTRVQMYFNGKDDFTKVNEAYAYGGIKRTMITLEEFLGIRIDHYLLIDVGGFKRVVDAIGGVDLYVDQDMKYDDFKQGLHIDLKAGQQHLNGEQAMHYVRYRKEYGDIGRIRRQQRFIWAVQQKIVSGKMLMKIPGLTAELFSMVRTNVPLSDMLPMARTLYDMVREHSFKMSIVPGTSEYLYDISYWTPHIVEMRKQVAELQGVPFEGRLVEAANTLNEVYTLSVDIGRRWQIEHDAIAEEEEKQKLLTEENAKIETESGKEQENIESAFEYRNESKRKVKKEKQRRQKRKKIKKDLKNVH